MFKEGNGINEVGDHLIRILISKEENQGKVYTHKNLKTKQRPHWSTEGQQLDKVWRDEQRDSLTEMGQSLKIWPLHDLSKDYHKDEDNDIKMKVI